MYDLIIVGGGPAGAAAGVYAGRKKMKTLLITDSFGGQSIVSDSIENWIGIKKISGFELAKMLEEHARSYEEVEIKNGEKVISVKEKEIKGNFPAQDEPAFGFEVSTDKGGVYQSKTLIVASGGRRRRLNIAGEDKFDGKGVSYCSTCDAPLFGNKEVAVIGGGNAGLEAAIDLISYASKVYIINRGPGLTGDPLTIEKVFPYGGSTEGGKKSPKVAIINNAEPQEILGGAFVTAIKYMDNVSGQMKELSVGGVFVEIGSVPNSEFMKGLVLMNKAGEIIVDHRTSATSRPGIFAAGDVTDEIYKQNNISAGDAVAAALSAYNYILNIKKRSPAL